MSEELKREIERHVKVGGDARPEELRIVEVKRVE